MTSGDDGANRRLEILAGGEPLVLDPLTAAAADEMFVLLAEPSLYRYLDEAAPASLEALRRTYLRRERRASPDGREQWLNWIVRGADGRAVGYVQATLADDGDARIGYVFGPAGQGRGLATRACAAMVEHLFRDAPTRRVLAVVDLANLRSVALLGRLGFVDATPADHAAAGCTPDERLFRKLRVPG